jgi:hypothetical protein
LLSQMHPKQQQKLIRPVTTPTQSSTPSVTPSVSSTPRPCLRAKASPRRPNASPSATCKQWPSTSSGAAKPSG